MSFMKPVADHFSCDFAAGQDGQAVYDVETSDVGSWYLSEDGAIGAGSLYQSVRGATMAIGNHLQDCIARKVR